MSMFYLVSTQIMADETKPCSILAYEDRDQAISAFHSTMASNYISENVLTCACYVANELGGILKTEYFQRDPAPTPEPEPEPEPQPEPEPESEPESEENGD